MNMSERQKQLSGESQIRTYGVYCSCNNCGKGHVMYFTFGTRASTCMCPHCGCYTSRPTYHQSCTESC